MRSDTQDDVSQRGRFLFVVFVAAPLVVWLAGPPILQADDAERACEQLRVEAEEESGEPTLGDLEWRYLPAAHWECTVGTETIDVGWWASTDG